MNITFLSMLERVGNYIHVFPALNMGRRDIWDNVIQETENGVERSMKMIDMFPSEFVIPGPSGKNETEMQIQLINGSTWQIMGADDDKAIDRMRGPNPIGVVLSEAAFMNPKVWKVLQPCLLENGGWVAFISTPNLEDDWFDQLCRFAEYEDGWFYQCATVEDTRRDAAGETGEPVITQAMLNEIRREPGVREEDIQREYYCNTKGHRLGTIYGDLYNAAESEKRIGNIPYIVNLPVGVCCDVGLSDIMAWWFYQRPDPYRIHFIDYYQDSLKGLDFYDRYFRLKNYVYGRMIFPWDGSYAATYFMSHGYRNCVVAPRPAHVWPAIDEVRRMWSQFYFNKTTCEVGLTCLKNYRCKWDALKMIYMKEPQHDQYSHGADALRTGVAGGFDPLEWFEGESKPLKVETDFDPRALVLGRGTML